MKCEYCEVALICTDPARFGGGCDMDGCDDFGCNPDADIWEREQVVICPICGADVRKRDLHNVYLRDSRSYIDVCAECAAELEESSS